MESKKYTIQTDSNSPILVVGVGIGGLAAACALRNKSFNIEQSEAAKEPTLDEDTGLRIWSYAANALRELGLHDLFYFMETYLRNWEFDLARKFLCQCLVEP